MGTDLPAACFLAFGLLALSGKHLDDACIFFALSAVFKPLGLLAACLALVYVVIVYTSERGDSTLSRTKILISLVLLTMSFARVYVATGNPIYPAWPLNLAPWGISEEIQRGLIDGTGVHGAALTKSGLRNYSGVDRSFLGTLEFAKNFVFFPHVVKSEYWFSPFLLVCIIISLYRILNEKYYRDIRMNSIYSYLIVGVLSIAWFYCSPLFRFIIGVLVFMNVRALIIAIRGDTRSRSRIAIYCVSVGTLFLFLVNVGQHVKEDIIPLATGSEEKVESLMPWFREERKTEFTTKRTEDGFVYSMSNSNFCQRLIPPCISLRSLGHEEKLIKEFRKYNNS